MINTNTWSRKKDDHDSDAGDETTFLTLFITKLLLCSFPRRKNPMEAFAGSFRSQEDDLLLDLQIESILK